MLQSPLPRLLLHLQPALQHVLRSGRHSTPPPSDSLPMHGDSQQAASSTCRRSVSACPHGEHPDTWVSMPCAAACGPPVGRGGGSGSTGCMQLPWHSSPSTKAALCSPFPPLASLSPALTLTWHLLIHEHLQCPLPQSCCGTQGRCCLLRDVLTAQHTSPVLTF